MRVLINGQTEGKVATPTFTPVRTGLLQRECACGGLAGLKVECEECGKKPSSAQRRAAHQAEPERVAPIVHEVLRSRGQPLDPSTRALMGARFGHNFARVRVHSDAKVAESAREAGAVAHTVGSDVAFRRGQYAPETWAGRGLLAYELAHTRQSARSFTHSDVSFEVADNKRLKEKHAAAAARNRDGRIDMRHPAASANTLFRQPTPQVSASPPQPPLITSRTGPPPGTGLRNPDLTERLDIEHAEQRRMFVLRAALPKLESIISSYRAKDTTAVKPYTKALTKLNLFGEMRDPSTPAGQDSISHLEKALDLLKANLNAPIPPHVIDEMSCPEDRYANAGLFDARDPRKPVLVCPVFFGARPECQAFVLAHEVFHLVGIKGHGTGKDYKPEWALSNPSSLVTFAWLLATGSDPYCDEASEAEPFPTSPRGVVV